MKTSTSLLIAVVAAISLKAQSFDSLNINQVNARLNAGGDLFWDPVSGQTHFKVPKTDGTNTIFAGNIWVGGYDTNGQLYMAAEQFSQNGNDFFPGPVMDAQHYAAEANKWNRVWKVNKSDVDSHLVSFNDNNYNIPQVFLDWPAHGDTTLGQAYHLAPFIDYDSDGIYDPSQGDAPAIRGDQAVLFIFNDDAQAHTESGGEKLRIQAVAMAYAFDCPQDEALEYTIFTHYRFTNFSNKAYWNSQMGVWTDFDIGNYLDDFVGCDVERGLYYGYNGDSHDEDITGFTGFKEFPPAQGVMFLAGPYQDGDGQDNLVGINPGESLNGMGYDDGLVDNERMGMMGFKYFNNGSGTTGSPTGAMDYYHYMNYQWLDGTYQYYGGNGHVNGGGDTTVLARYMFPNNTDPLGWGTYGNPQAPWSEITAGNNPSDRRGIGSTGRFTWQPGAIQDLDMAYIFAQDFNQPYDSMAPVILMQQRADAVREMFFNDSTTCGVPFIPDYYDIINNTNTLAETHLDISVFPNPASNYLFVKLDGTEEQLQYAIYNTIGQVALQGSLQKGTTQVNTSKLPAGVYFIKAGKENAVLSERFIKQ